LICFLLTKDFCQNIFLNAKIKKIETPVFQTSVMEQIFATQRTPTPVENRSVTTSKPTAQMTSGFVKMGAAYLSPSPARKTNPQLGEMAV
jgi:hypothetical protein